MNAAIEDHFNDGGQVGLGDRWQVDWVNAYEEGQDPWADLGEFYNRSIDWSTVPNWTIVDVIAGVTTYDLTFGPNNSTVLYNPYDNGNYGWSRPGSTSCFEDEGQPLTYRLEAVHPSGTILRFFMNVIGTD